MPTSRPRHTVTETDEVAAALRAAAKRWPEERGRGKLLLRLLREGHLAIGADQQAVLRRRQETLRRTAGALTGSYPADYLERLRDDWPA